MADNHSFTEYVRQNFTNELAEALEIVLLDTDTYDLGLSPYGVNYAENISLNHINVKSVSASDSPSSEITFEVIVEATIDIHYLDEYRYNEPKTLCKYYVVECNGDLDLKLNDFNITTIKQADKTHKFCRPLSDALIPYIRKDNIEKEAERFLQRYYPEALERRVSLDPFELAERMGLNIIFHTITNDHSVFGQIFFAETDAELYDNITDVKIHKHVIPGTIIVDPDATVHQTVGLCCNTIVHECVHWALHKKAFMLAQIYNEKLSQIKCKVTGDAVGFNGEDSRWMEWQANSLAPRILMPLKMFTLKAKETINRLQKETGKQELCGIIEPVIEDLALYFGVSKLSAKIRMIDAGFEEARGAFIYIDGKYIKPIAFKKGALKNNETYSIPVRDAVIQGLTNPLLKNSSHYIYVDSHFVLNHPKFIYTNEDGEVLMTDYARMHADECCLPFRISIKGKDKDYHIEYFLNRARTTYDEPELDFVINYSKMDDKQREKYLIEYDLKWNSFLSELPNDFVKSWKIALDKQKINAADLARISGYKPHTVGDIIKKRGEGSLQSIVALCLAAHFPWSVSNHIINLSPYNLTIDNRDHQYYSFALHHYYIYPFDTIRKFFLENNIPVVLKKF